MSEEKTTSWKKISTENRVLLIVAIILLFSCLFGAGWQYYTYGTILAENPKMNKSQEVTDTRSNYGKIMGALSSYNNGPRAAADQAINMAIFLTIGCAIGAWLLYYTLKKIRREEKAAEEAKEQQRYQIPNRPKRKPPIITH